MTVHFIGAGPGAADLITVRGARPDRRRPVCLYAGSAGAATSSLAYCPPGARVVDTAPLTLDEIIAELAAAHARRPRRRPRSTPATRRSSARSPSRCAGSTRSAFPYDVTPGVPAFAAAAAALGRELTVPEVGQTVILTRTAGRATADAGGRGAGDARREPGDARAAPGRPADRRGSGRARCRTTAPTARSRWSPGPAATTR